MQVTGTLAQAYPKSYDSNNKIISFFFLILIFFYLHDVIWSLLQRCNASDSISSSETTMSLPSCREFGTLTTLRFVIETLAENNCNSSIITGEEISYESAEAEFIALINFPLSVKLYIYIFFFLIF